MKRLTILLLLLAAPAWGADPVISEVTVVGGTGEVVDGATITVDGSNFGSKSPPGPIVFSDFDDGSNMAVISDASWDYVGAGSTDPPRYSDGYLRDGSGLCIRMTSPDSSSGSTLQEVLVLDDLADSGVGDILWFSVFCSTNFTGPDEVGSVPIANKWYRVARSAGGSHPAVYAHWNGDISSDSCDRDVRGNGIVTVSDNTGDPIGSYTQWIGCEDLPDTNTWHQYEIWGFANSDYDVADGYAQVWYDAQLVKETSHTKDIFLSGQPEGFNEWKSVHMLCYMRGVPEGRKYIYRYDDVYVDDTAARAFLGDRATLATCTVREYCIPTAWASGELTLTVNAGAFEADDNVYLYVYNDTNEGNSSGYPLTIGGEAGGSGEDPNQPIATSCGDQ